MVRPERAEAAGRYLAQAVLKRAPEPTLASCARAVQLLKLNAEQNSRDYEKNNEASALSAWGGLLVGSYRRF